MPIPLLIIGAVVASLRMTGHSAVKQRKWKIIRDGRLAEVQAVPKEANQFYTQLETAGKSLGQARIQAVNTLKEAAEYLHAILQNYGLEHSPQIPSDFLKEWIDLHSEIGKSLGRASPVLPCRVLRRPLGPLFTRQPGYLALRPLAPE